MISELIYDIQAAPTVKSLKMQVQGALQQGWMPLGGMTNYAGTFYQPMLLEIEVTDEEIQAEIDKQATE